MSLSAAEVAEIMRLIEQSRFDELSLEMDGVKLTLRRAGPSGAVIPVAMMPRDIAAAAVGPPDAPAVAPDLVDAGVTAIASPLLGTFYRAPTPGAAPFVEIGSVVDEDSVIAIIEVMKLMNTVRAGVRGTITEILPADETLVEFGELLMRVRRDA